MTLLPKTCDYGTFKAVIITPIQKMLPVWKPTNKTDKMARALSHLEDTLSAPLMEQLKGQFENHCYKRIEKKFLKGVGSPWLINLKYVDLKNVKNKWLWY